MDLGEAVLLGVTEGLTEFLPVSSTGHLTVVEKLLGLRLDDPGVTAFTAIIQLGPILAVLIFFRRDIVALAGGWLHGITTPSRRGDQYRLAWAVISARSRSASSGSSAGTPSVPPGACGWSRLLSSAGRW